MASMRITVNITKWQIFRLSIPIFFSNMAIPLVGIVDTGLMGHLDSEKYLIAASISTTFLTMIFWSFGFLRMGTVGLISQALGKADYRELAYIIIRNIFIAIFVSFLIIIFKPILIHILGLIFETSFETKQLIEDYISIRLFSAPAELVIYVLIGFYLGVQKTFISSLLIIFFSLLNILFSVYFVTELNLNIAGVALGTLTAAYLIAISFIIFTYYFMIKKFKVIPRINSKIIFNYKKLLKLLNINFDIFIRTVLLTFSFFWITYLSSTLGEEYVAINSILIQLVIISSFFLDAYAFSTESIIGYSIGKKSERMFLSSVKNSIILSFTTGIIISLIFFLSAKEIINLITDIEFLRYLSYKYILWVIIIPPIACFCYQMDGIYVGATQTKEMRNSMIICVAIYITLSLFLVKEIHNYGIWFSLILFMVLRASTLHFFFPKILKKFR